VSEKQATKRTMRIEVEFEPWSQDGDTESRIRDAIAMIRGVTQVRSQALPAVELVRQCRDQLDRLLANHEARQRGEDPRPIVSTSDPNKFYSRYEV
jgi:hypothetical protein